MSEETYSPRGLTIADLDFLADLQHEMNTQDTLGQRDPRFWVVMDYEYRSAAPDETPTHVLEVTEGCDYARYGVDELVRVAYEDVLENDGAGAAAEWLGDMCLHRAEDSHGAYALIRRPGFDLDEVCEGYFSPRCSQWVCQVKEPCIADNTMFLTRAAALEHLKENCHHYDVEAHTYAMTAWRSPQVEGLYMVLHEVDFTAMRGLVSQAPTIRWTFDALDGLLAEDQGGTVTVPADLLDAVCTVLLCAGFATGAIAPKGMAA